MCGRVIQSGGPLRYGIVEGLDVPDNRTHNYPPRWNAAPSQELLVIRRNHRTGEVSLDPLRWGLIPYWCQDPKGGRKPINAKCETVDRLPMFRDAYLTLMSQFEAELNDSSLLTVLPFSSRHLRRFDGIATRTHWRPTSVHLQFVDLLRAQASRLSKDIRSAA